MYLTLEEAEQNKTSNKLWLIAASNGLIYLTWK